MGIFNLIYIDHVCIYYFLKKFPKKLSQIWKMYIKCNFFFYFIESYKHRSEQRTKKKTATKIGYHTHQQNTCNWLCERCEMSKKEKESEWWYV